MKQETNAIHLFESEWVLATSNRPSHIVRIESNYTQQGIPDLNICFVGIEFWCEFKFDGEVRPLQIGWAVRRRMAGGVVYTLDFQSHLDGRFQAKQYVHNILMDLERRGFHV